MSISLIVSCVGALVAAIGLGILMARCFRAPRGDLVAWSVALLGLVVALGAQALGHLLGFSEVSFRAMEIGAALITPLALTLGLAEAVATSLPGRFAARLFIPALGFVSVVILGTDPLTGSSFTKGWPPPSAHYQLIPNKLIEYGLAPITLLVAVILVGVVAVRSRRERAWGGLLPAAAAIAVAILALAIPGLEPVLSDRIGLTLPLSSLFASLCLVAVVLTWYAGVAAERVPLAALRGGSYRDADEDEGDLAREAWGRAAAPREAPARSVPLRGGGPPDFESYDDGGQGVYRDGGLYRDEPAGAGNAGGPPGDDTGYGWQDRAGGYQDGYPATGHGEYDSRQFDPAYGPGGYETGSQDGYDAEDQLPGGQAARYGAGPLDPGYAAAPPAKPDGFGAGAVAAARPEATRAQLFGQIAIYTLIEDRVHEFDRLTERVVVQVREREPDTLVFIVHAVPSAPMQRILYEVYRDRAAYDWHEQQSYVMQFEADRQPYVLATNVIELGLQQAKVSPFPSIVDLFGEPAYDTSGFERPDYTRDYGTSAGQPSPGGASRNDTVR